jgi:hypothetical protein
MPVLVLLFKLQRENNTDGQNQQPLVNFSGETPVKVIKNFYEQNKYYHKISKC